MIFWLASVSLFLGGSGCIELGSNTKFANPIRENAPDPSLRVWNNKYYLLPTRGDRITIVATDTLTGLATAPELVVWPPAGVVPDARMRYDIWAPELELVGNHWYIYFTAGDGTKHPQHPEWPLTQKIFVIESDGTDDPVGPYHLVNGGAPVVDPGGSRQAIDPALLRYNGEMYLLWSQYDEIVGDHDLYIAKMATPWSIIGASQCADGGSVGPGCRLKQPTRDFERQGIPALEAPAVLERNGSLFITYSASSCGSDDYATGILTYLGGDILDRENWQKSADPVLRKTDGAYGVGGAGFFRSPDGTEDWVYYHANPLPGQGCGGYRALRAQRITWGGDEPLIGPTLSPQASQDVPRVDPVNPVLDGRYKLLVRWGFNALETQDCRQDTGANVRVFPYRAGDLCHQWDVTSLGDGTYKIAHALSGLSLGSCAGIGGDVHVGSFVGTECQRWRIQPAVVAAWAGVTHRYYRITNVNSGYALDAQECNTTEYPDAILYRYELGLCHQWRIETP